MSRTWDYDIMMLDSTTEVQSICTGRKLELTPLTKQRDVPLPFQNININQYMYVHLVLRTLNKCYIFGIAPKRLH